MTVCNMSIECGARGGMIAPDEKTFEYLRGRERAPQGAAYDEAVARWRELYSDPDAVFDREYRFDAADIAPMITYGTNPGMGMAVDGTIPGRRRSQGAGVHGFQTRGADVGQSGRLRVRRQLYQRPHRGPAPFRPSGRRPPQGGQHHRMDRSRLEGRRSRRAGRGTGPHPRRSGFRTPPAGLFGVPGDERRPRFRRANTAFRPRTAISRAGRVPAPVRCCRAWPLPPPPR